MSEPIEIQWFERLSDHPHAAQLALRGWFELQEKGLIDGMRDIAIRPDMMCALAIAPDGKQEVPAGVMVYSVDDPLRRVWLDLSYTAQEFRGRGVYKALWNAMVDRVKGTGVLTIESAVNVRNDAMRRIAKKQHREERFIMLRYVVTL